MNFTRMLELQLAAERHQLTAQERDELAALELAWHNAALTDRYDIPVRS